MLGNIKNNIIKYTYDYKIMKICILGKKASYRTVGMIPVT